MAQPTLTDVHVNVPLTNLSIAYMQDDANFIADKVFPTVPVQKQSDRYFEYNRDAFFRSDVTERAAGAESDGTGYTLTNTSTYSARVYSVHDDVPDQVRSNSDSVLQPEVDATYLVTEQLMIKREKIFLSNYFATSLWTGGSGGATDQTGVTGTPGANQFARWDQAGSTPIEDVRTQALSIAEKTGKKPNTLVLGPYVANQLINNPEIVDRVKYTQLGFLDYNLLAAAFGVDKVLVPLAVNNTATEGATLSNAFIYGKSALLVYSAPAPGLRTASGGYTFAWQGYLGGTATIQIKQFYMPWLEATRIEGSMAFDMKLMGADLGVFFNTAVS